MRYMLDTNILIRSRACLQGAGTLICANDLWIACHVLAEGCVLVSNSEREFRRIDGLAVENWASG